MPYICVLPAFLVGCVHLPVMLKVSLDKKRPEKENMMLKFERFWWTFRKHKIRSIFRGINIQIILFAFKNIPQHSPFNIFTVI